ncbi:MAG: hypothetical protein MHM6MM_008020 [Cercozoa sp. M6MM]
MWSNEAHTMITEEFLRDTSPLPLGLPQNGFMDRTWDTVYKSDSEYFKFKPMSPSEREQSISPEESAQVLRNALQRDWQFLTSRAARYEDLQYVAARVHKKHMVDLVQQQEGLLDRSVGEAMHDRLRRHAHAQLREALTSEQRVAMAVHDANLSPEDERVQQIWPRAVFLADRLSDAIEHDAEAAALREKGDAGRAMQLTQREWQRVLGNAVLDLYYERPSELLSLFGLEQDGSKAAVQHIGLSDSQKLEQAVCIDRAAELDDVPLAPLSGYADLRQAQQLADLKRTHARYVAERTLRAARTVDTALDWLKAAAADGVHAEAGGWEREFDQGVPRRLSRGDKVRLLTLEARLALLSAEERAVVERQVLESFDPRLSSSVREVVVGGGLERAEPLLPPPLTLSFVLNAFAAALQPGVATEADTAALQWDDEAELRRLLKHERLADSASQVFEAAEKRLQQVRRLRSRQRDLLGSATTRVQLVLDDGSALTASADDWRMAVAVQTLFDARVGALGGGKTAALSQGMTGLSDDSVLHQASAHALFGAQQYGLPSLPQHWLARAMLANSCGDGRQQWMPLEQVLRVLKRVHALESALQQQYAGVQDVARQAAAALDGSSDSTAGVRDSVVPLQLADVADRIVMLCQRTLQMLEDPVLCAPLLEMEHHAGTLLKQHAAAEQRTSCDVESPDSGAEWFERVVSHISRAVTEQSERRDLAMELDTSSQFDARPTDANLDDSDLLRCAFHAGASSDDVALLAAPSSGDWTLPLLSAQQGRVVALTFDTATQQLDDKSRQLLAQEMRLFATRMREVFRGKAAEWASTKHLHELVVAGEVKVDDLSAVGIQLASPVELLRMACELTPARRLEAPVMRESTLSEEEQQELRRVMAAVGVSAVGDAEALDSLLQEQLLQGRRVVGVHMGADGALEADEAALQCSDEAALSDKALQEDVLRDRVLSDWDDELDEMRLRFMDYDLVSPNHVLPAELRQRAVAAARERMLPWQKRAQEELLHPPAHRDLRSSEPEVRQARRERIRDLEARTLEKDPVPEVFSELRLDRLGARRNTAAEFNYVPLE